MTMQEKRVLHCGPYTYSPEDSLGQGSFAEVFKGVSKDGVDVAIKRIPKSKLGRPNNKRLLETEISILQTMRHPNIVQLLDNVDTPEFICLVMEYCDGGDLASFISAHVPMPEADIALVLHQLVAALNYLGERNILHRDLKPQNILLQKSAVGMPIIKIADFGFARELYQEDLAATFCGSPLYMAPEVLDGDSYNAMADLWSVGTIVYQCLTGVAPYRAQSIKALKEMMHSGNRPLIPSTTSPALADLLTGLLEVDPQARMTLARLSTHEFLAEPPARHASVGGRPASTRSAPVGRTPSGGLPVAAAVNPGPMDGLDGLAVSKQDIDDHSYILIDKGFVDVNTLADSIDRRMRVGANTSGRSPAELVAMLERVIGPATAVIHVANERLSGNPENALAMSMVTPTNRLQARGEALLLYAKGLNILRSGLTNLRALIGRSGVQLTPALHGAVQTLRTRFNEAISKIEAIRADMTPAGMRTVFASAEQVLYYHALMLAREAARAENTGNLSSGEVLYNKALTLLQVVSADAQGQESIDIKALLVSLNDRLQLVRQQEERDVQAGSRGARQHDDRDLGATSRGPRPYDDRDYDISRVARRQDERELGAISRGARQQDEWAARHQDERETGAISRGARQQDEWVARRQDERETGTASRGARESSTLLARVPSGRDLAESAIVPSESLSAQTARHRVTVTHPSSINLLADPLTLRAEATNFDMLRNMMMSSSPPQIAGPRVSPPLGTSPLLEIVPASFCGDCGMSFQSPKQRFCMKCGAPRTPSLDRTALSPTH
eukprot:m.222837 g.222837  ORF g.222837 m.222837 type:complete len:788 (-) comp10834_c0_seq1:283-2646(-)